MFRFLYCFSLLLFATLHLQAATITGKVVDAQQQPLAGANVVLLLADTNVLVKAVLADNNGAFLIENVPDGQYALKTSLLGFDDYTSEKITVVGSNVVIPAIVMAVKSTTLQEANVRAQKPLIEVHPDKLVMNVENSIVSAGSSVMEVLQRAPGVNVDNNDNISLKGKGGTIIMIDGKPVPVGGQDLANMLKSMPSASVEKIELISNPGARYDAAGNAGIINIRTKRDKRMGLNGSVNGSYAQGVYPKMGIGGSVNYRNKKWTINANYNYGYRYWFNHLMLNRRFLDTASPNADQQLFAYLQNNYAVYNFKNHSGGLNIDYALDKKTIIGLVASAGTNAFEPRVKNLSSAVGPNNELLYNFNTIGNHTNTWNNASLNLNMRHTYDSAGRELTVDADYARYWSTSNQNFHTTYSRPDGSQYLPDYFMSSDLQGNTQIRSVKTDYVHPLSGKARLDVGLKASYVTADNEPLFYEKVNGVFELDIKRSNHFIYNENINAAYVTFNKEWDKWGTQIGVRTEQTNVNWNQVTTNQQYDTSYLQLFPSVAVQRHLNPKHDLGLTLSRRIDRPNYEQLNPFKFYIDKTTYREGFPYLKPASSYNFELSHTYNQRLITSLSYSETKNVITEVIQPSDNEDSVTVQTNKNLDKMRFIGLSGSYSFTITKWWTNITNFNAYYAHYEGFLANTTINNGAPTYNIYTNNTFLLPKEFSAELSGWYQARQVYGFMDLRPMWMLNLGLQKTFWQKRATVRLNAQDIFWKGYPRATSTYTGYEETFVAQRDTRQFTISLSYRFGQRTVPTMRRRTGGAEDEKNRAGTGGA